jgi:hypothetical protein
LALVIFVAVVLVMLVPAEMLAVIVPLMMLGLFRFLGLLFEFMLATLLWMPVAVAPVIGVAPLGALVPLMVALPLLKVPSAGRQPALDHWMLLQECTELRMTLQKSRIGRKRGV